MGAYEGTGGQNRAGRRPPSYRGTAPYIFVSYAHSDKDMVYREIRRFTEDGFYIWYDEGIAPGADYEEQIGQAIKDCAAFVVMITPRSAVSKYVEYEIKYARRNDKNILPIYLERTTLGDGLDFTIGGLQAIHRFEITEDEYHFKYYNTFMNMGVWPTEKVRTRQTNTGTQQRSSSASGRSAQAGTATGFKTTRYSTAQDAANRSSGQSAKQTSGSAGKKPEGTAGSAAGTAAGKPSDPKKDKEKSGESKGGIFGVLVVCALIYLLAGSCDSTDTKTTAATTTKSSSSSWITKAANKFTMIHSLTVTVKVGEEETIKVSIIKPANDTTKKFGVNFLKNKNEYTEYADVEWVERDESSFTLKVKGKKSTDSIPYKRIDLELLNSDTNEVLDTSSILLKVTK